MDNYDKKYIKYKNKYLNARQNKQDKQDKQAGGCFGSNDEEAKGYLQERLAEMEEMRNTGALDHYLSVLYNFLTMCVDTKINGAWLFMSCLYDIVFKDYNSEDRPLYSVVNDISSNIVGKSIILVDGMNFLYNKNSAAAFRKIFPKVALSNNPYDDKLMAPDFFNELYTKYYGNKNFIFIVVIHGLNFSVNKLVDENGVAYLYKIEVPCVAENIKCVESAYLKKNEVDDYLLMLIYINYLTNSTRYGNPNDSIYFFSGDTYSWSICNKPLNYANLNIRGDFVSFQLHSNIKPNERGQIGTIDPKSNFTTKYTSQINANRVNHLINFMADPGNSNPFAIKSNRIPGRTPATSASAATPATPILAPRKTMAQLQLEASKTNRGKR